MMSKVRPGDPLRITADTFNSFIDAADAHQRGMFSMPGPQIGGAGIAGAVLVRNASGQDQGRFAILAITGVAIAPADNLPAFQRQPVFTVGPAEPDTAKLVILQEPIAVGRMGRALVAGVSPVRIRMDDPAHGFARPTDDDPTKLTSNGSGSFKILYVESGTGDKWAAVHWPVAEAKGLVAIKYNGSWSGRRYGGSIINDDGSTGATVQFIIPNDPGVEPLLSQYNEVYAVRCPTRLDNHSDWSSTGGDKYVAVAICPWAALG